MVYKIEFLPEAAREFERLDGSLRKIAAKHRIVYEIVGERLKVLIIGIGKRERAEIYREVAERLKRFTL